MLNIPVNSYGNVGMVSLQQLFLNQLKGGVWLWYYNLFHDQSPRSMGPGSNLIPLDLQSDMLLTVLCDPANKRSMRICNNCYTQHTLYIWYETQTILSIFSKGMKIMEHICFHLIVISHNFVVVKMTKLICIDTFWEPKLIVKYHSFRWTIFLCVKL